MPLALALALAGASATLAGCGARVVEAEAAAEREEWERPPGSVVPRGLEVPLVVRETAGLGRTGEVAAGGIPLPRRLALQSAEGLAVVDGEGRRVPAEMRVLARWPVPRGLGPVQWLWVAFPVTVGPSATAAYRLVPAAALAGGADALRLEVSRGAGGIVVDTGAARFVVSGDGALFAEVGLAGGEPIARGRPLAGRVAGVEVDRVRPRRLEVVRTGPLRAVVVAEAELDRPAIGGGAVSAWWRYELTAGSPTAVVREVVQWEGMLGCPGCVLHEGRPAGVRLDGVGDELVLARPATRALVLAGGGAPGLEASRGEGPPLVASLRQLQRSRRKQGPRFEASVNERHASGRYADRAVLAAATERGTLAVSIRALHRYEPQALALDAEGAVRLALADGPAWLANHQGAFATMAVAALPAGVAASELETAVWAPLNRPLRPWPAADWLARERPIDEVPFGPLPASLRPYDETIPRVLRATLDAVEREGVDGLMTFGVYPRYWGEHEFAELDCRGGDPTPDESWDDAFWCGAWTDYHHTVATAAVWAMRTGEMEWLDELSHPGALRTLHTQMMQCGPQDEWFYCGQAPTGYGAYRTDFNSSHAYFDNLLYYYRTSGDETVVERLRRGAGSMSRWARDKRDVVMRAAAQWQAVARFLGTVGERDLEQFFRWGVETAVGEHYVELERDGERFGFWSHQPEPQGSAVHRSLFATAFYDFENLHDAMRDTGDAPLGPQGVRPSRALVHLARSYVRLAGTLEGGGGAVDGSWSRGLAIDFAPPRVGGRLERVATEPGEPKHFFAGDKPAMAAFLMYAAQLSGDPELRRSADELLAYSLGRVASRPLPFGKLMGLGLHRVHPAVAAAAAGTVEEPPR